MIVPQRAEVGATEGIAWELLWKLIQIKKGKGSQHSDAGILNGTLPGFLEGSGRTARTLEADQHFVPVQKGADLQIHCQLCD